MCFGSSFCVLSCVDVTVIQLWGQCTPACNGTWPFTSRQDDSSPTPHFYTASLPHTHRSATKQRHILIFKPSDRYYIVRHIWVWIICSYKTVFSLDWAIIRSPCSYCLSGRGHLLSRVLKIKTGRSMTYAPPCRSRGELCPKPQVAVREYLQTSPSSQCYIYYKGYQPLQQFKPIWFKSSRHST